MKLTAAGWRRRQQRWATGFAIYAFVSAASLLLVNAIGTLAFPNSSGFEVARSLLIGIVAPTALIYAIDQYKRVQIAKAIDRLPMSVQFEEGEQGWTGIVTLADQSLTTVAIPDEIDCPSEEAFQYVLRETTPH